MSKVFRIRFSINGSDPKIYKVKADGYEAAKRKFVSTFKFEEMLSGDEVNELGETCDKIINTLNGMATDNSRV